MSATIQLRLLDDYVLAQVGMIEVGGEPIIVGDMQIPKGAGWQADAPGKPGSSFVPYAVVYPGTVGPAPGTGSFSKPQQDWHTPYAIAFFGESREQMRWMADQARTIFAALTHEVIPLEVDYKVQQVWTQSIGAPQRNPATNPPFYEETDQITFWLAKK